LEANIRSFLSATGKVNKGIRDTLKEAPERFIGTTHPLTQEFFATVQNKVHYAIHGQTAAELIQSRAASSKPNIGVDELGGCPYP